MKQAHSLKWTRTLMLLSALAVGACNDSVPIGQELAAC
jgi:hypothetical protein